MDNANSQEYLEKIQLQVIDNLKRTTTHAPSVQMTDVPRDSIGINDDDDAALDDLDEDTHADQRKTKRRWDKYIERDDELSASEDEEENERNGVRRQPGKQRRRNIMDYRNPNAAPEDEEMASGAVSPARRNGTQNGRSGHTPDGSGQGSSNHDDDDELDNDNGNRSNSNMGDQSDLEDAPLDDEAAPEDDDGDLDMEDDSNDNTTHPTPAPQPRLPTPQRQEATPPDSPPQLAAQVPAPTQQAANDIGNDDMDEGDTILAGYETDTSREEEMSEREREAVRRRRQLRGMKMVGMLDES